MKLIVCSKSTTKYAKEMKLDGDEIRVITEPPNINTLKEEDEYHDVVAIGGGSVIDTGKILSMNAIVAIPTTYSGAAGTSHAVYWHKGKKHNVECKLPKVIYKQEYIHLPKHVEAASKIDCMAHLIESLVSKSANERSTGLAMRAILLIRKDQWLKASVLAGRCIEITGTNLIHGMSYPLTGNLDLSHGASLAYIFELASHYKKTEELL